MTPLPEGKKVSRDKITYIDRKDLIALLEGLLEELPKNKTHKEGSPAVIYSSQEFLDGCIQAYNDGLNETKSAIKAKLATLRGDK